MMQFMLFLNQASVWKSLIFREQSYENQKAPNPGPGHLHIAVTITDLPTAAGVYCGCLIVSTVRKQIHAA